MGNAIDRLAGDAPAAVDAIRGRKPGTTRSLAAETAANPPDIGQMDYSLTARAGPVAVTTGTGGNSVTLSASYQFTVTADATYTAPGSSSSALGIGAVFGDGLVAGGQWNGGSGTLSVGVGFSVPLTALGTTLDPVHRAVVKALEIVGSYTSLSDPVGP